MNDLPRITIMPPTPPSHAAARSALTAAIGRASLVGGDLGIFSPAIIRAPAADADRDQVAAYLNTIFDPEVSSAIEKRINAGNRTILVHGGIASAATADDRLSATQCTHIDLSRPGSCSISTKLCGQLSSIEGRPSLIRLDHHARPVSAVWHDFNDALELWQATDGPLHLTLDGHELAAIIRQSVDVLDELGADTMHLSAMADHAELAADAGKPVNVRMHSGKVDTLTLSRELRCAAPPIPRWTGRP
jgi:hypothetical protein